jgi:carbonic anhydrase
LGKPNEFLDTLISAGLPEKKDDSVESHVTINLTEGLVRTSNYYTYPGSLTTPPCSEIVTWIVLKKQATMSEEQFKAFNRIMGNNFRPLQDRNARTIRVRASRYVHDDRGDD